MRLELDVVEDKPCHWRPYAAFSGAEKLQECGGVVVEVRKESFPLGCWPCCLGATGSRSGKLTSSWAWAASVTGREL